MSTAHQTEATLLDTALTKPYSVTTAQGKETQHWYFPSRADCQACHTGAGANVDNWKTVPSRASCGSCHDLPPPTPIHVAIQGTQGCGTSVNPAFACHPAGYSKYTVDPKLHMDGQICPPNCTPVSP